MARGANPFITHEKMYNEIKRNYYNYMSRYQQHLFICTNEGKEICCSAKGSAQMAKNLKLRCRQAFGQEVRINRSGCLGSCKNGIVAVLYPEGKYFENLSERDEDMLFAEVAKRMGDK
tara:strand:- start:3262 stop:3615 length:354 start_codon:yes stop_codon:yes gene_type:complete